MISTTVPLFHEMCEILLTFDPARLDEGGGIEATLRGNVAKYHASCCRMFNNIKMERARKRHSDVQSESEEGQAKHSQTCHDSEACIFCDRIAPASDLRQVMTMHVKSLEDNPSSFYEPIRNNSLDFFRHDKPVTEPSKQKQMKEECQLFSMLFISCQSRECNLQFFQHENQLFPDVSE